MLSTIGITAGDPAGIGLEVVLKAIPPLLEEANWVLFADQDAFLLNLERFEPTLPWSQASRRGSPASRMAAGNHTGLLVHDLGSNETPVVPGRGNPATGKRALFALETASQTTGRTANRMNVLRTM